MHRSVPPGGALASHGARPAPAPAAVQPGGCGQADDEATDRAQKRGRFGVGLAVATAIGRHPNALDHLLLGLERRHSRVVLVGVIAALQPIYISPRLGSRDLGVEVVLVFFVCRGDWVVAQLAKEGVELVLEQVS